MCRSIMKSSSTFSCLTSASNLHFVQNFLKLLEPQKIDPNAKSFSKVTKPAIGVGFVSSNSEVAGAAAVWILFYPIFLRSEREGVG